MHMTNKRVDGRWLVPLILVGLLSGTACRREDHKVRIGSILGLTGPNSAYGQEMLSGFQFAVDEVNTGGGVNGTPVELAVEDSQFDPTKAVTAYRRLIATQGIRLIVGITGSKNAIAVCSAARGEDVLILDPLGSAPILTTYGGKTYFRIMASDAFAGRYNVDWAIEAGMKRPMILYQEDEWGTSYRDEVLSYLRNKGFPETPTLGVVEGTRDFKTHVQRVKAKHPDVLFMLVYAGSGAAFMRDLRLGGLNLTVYGSDNISSDEFVSAGAEAIEHVRVAMPRPVKSRLLDDFTARYRAKKGDAPDANIIKSYDAMQLMITGIRSYGAVPERLVNWLHSTQFSFDGVSGPIHFDEHGDFVGQQYARMVYRSGQLVGME
jgi:branched-chain amino acid transport system substrate-binding protein